MSSNLDNPPKLDKPDFSREHRLGLVVYGGIALAIYMNGICQEFYNAVRGRGIYKLLKALTDADIVVDIISGTSAGGINGVLLSYALANSQEGKHIKFEEFAKVWKDSGDIYKLLFDKTHDGVEKSSFFNGVGYYKVELEKALKDRINDLKEEALNNDWFSEFGKLDLFVTGTDLLGKIHQVFDNTGCVIEIKDHHATFHLKYREHGDNNFKPDTLDRKDITCEALAKLCQITSCFPVAFPPVTVKLDSQGDADEKLVKWGSLKKNRILAQMKSNEDTSRSLDERVKKIIQQIVESGSLIKNRIVPEAKQEENTLQSSDKRVIDDDPGKGYRLHFVDGGVLDNRPFSYTIKEIYHRTAERPVFRKLFYIDPSPDRFKNNSKYEEMLKPGIVQVVRDSLIGMPRYESINNDLELIKEHNEKVLRYKFLMVDLLALLDKEIPDEQNRDFYDQQRNVYLRTRLISLEDKLLPLVFLESEDFEKASIQGKDRTEKLYKVAQLLAKPFTDPQGSSQRLELLTRLEQEICNLDVDYALRHYFFITEYVYKLLDEDYLREWLKTKRKEEIEQEFKKRPENQNNKNQEVDELVRTNEENNDNKKKKEINEIFDNSSIFEPILRKLKFIIIILNKHIEIIEVIKENLDKFFISEEIEKYFFDLLDEFPDESYEKFPEKFYRVMLWLHGYFLNIELPSTLNVKQLSARLKKRIQELKLEEPKSRLDTFFLTSNQQQVDELQELAKNSILKKLLDKTEEELLSNVDRGDEHYDFILKKLQKYFKEFEKLDTVLYPLDYLAGIPEKQLIETFRISPEDAKFGFSSQFKDGERLDKKLAGDTLNAFGGFFKKSWRANDILWGRLDGLNRIVEALVTEDKIKDFPKFLRNQANQASQANKKEIKPAEYLDYLLEEALLFDSCKSDKDKQYLMQKKDELKEKIEGLFKPSLYDESSHLSIPKKSVFKDFVESLVSVGHLVILNQDFDNTMQVSIEEQLTKEQIAQLELNETPQFDPKMRSFNSPINTLAVRQLAKQSLDTMSLKEKKRFFYNDYKVGSETLDDIPKSELRNIILRFIVILQDIISTWQHKTQTKSSRAKSKNLSFRRPRFWKHLGFKLMGFILGLGICLLKVWARFF